MVNHHKCAEFMKVQLKTKSNPLYISNVIKKKKSHRNFFLAYRLSRL